MSTLYYNAGTATVVTGSATVTGTGTAWVSGIPRGYVFIGPDGLSIPIDDVVSNTELTLAAPYRGSGAGGQQYFAIPAQGQDREFALQVAGLIGRYSSELDARAHFEDVTIPGYDALVAGYYPALVAEASAELPAYNLLPDSGQLMATREASNLATAFAACDFLTPMNGATAWAEVGKFIHGNSDYGGGGAAMAEPVKALLTRYGQTRQTGVEFYVAEMTAGTGTATGASFGGIDYYLLTINNLRKIPHRCTIGLYLRVVSGGVYISLDHEQDSVAVSGGILPTNEWRYVRIELTREGGVQNSLPGLRALPGSVVQMALPSIIPGTFARVEYDKVLPVLSAGAYE